MVPQIDLLKRLVLSKFPMTIIQTEDYASVLSMFALLAKSEKRGFFTWTPGVGLHQLTQPERPIVGTKSTAGALSCIQKSQHFGHFLIHGDMFNMLHNEQCEATVQQLLQVPEKSFRKVFVIGKQPKIPNHLKSKIIVIRLSSQYSGQI